VPCLASFWAEFLVFVAAVKVWPVLGALAILGLVVSALFVLRVAQKTFFGPSKEEWKDLPDMGWFMASPRYLLAATLLLFGVLPSLMLSKVTPSVAPLVETLNKAMGG
jgi:NADH-quinone oxidoreductase subunit M